MITPTQEDRRCVGRWRGLKEHVLDELSELDRQAIARGACRFLGIRTANIADRERCKELRAKHGLSHMEKLRI